MLQGMMDQLANFAGSDPRGAMRLLLSRVPERRRPSVSELGSFFGRVYDLGPPDPPPWAWDIFRELGTDYSISPELLAAVSYVAVNWDPYGTEHRVGLLGVPDLWIDRPEEELRATTEELLEGDRKAALRVFRSTELAVELLREVCKEEDDHTRGIERYLGEGHGSETWTDPADELEEVLVAYLIFLGRSVGSEGV